MPGYLMGVDVGSYESKGVLADHNGMVVAQHVCKHKLEFVKDGHVEHDAEAVWWKEFCTISKALIEKAGIDPKWVAGVGVSTVFSMLPVDRNGDPTRRGGIMYGIDTRATAEISELNARFGRDEIFQSAGNTLSSQSMGPKILWLKHNEPNAYNNAAYFLTGAAFIVGRLTGEFVMSHFDAAFYSPLYDLENQSWSARLCDGIVEVNRLPRLQWSTEVAGSVNQKASEATGLAVGTPVAVGTSDAAAEAFSIGVTEPGHMMMMYGSVAWMTLIVDKPLKNPALWSSPFLFEGTYCLHASIMTSGSLTRWIRDITAREILNDAQESGDEAYSALAMEAAAVHPGSDGLIVLPYFSGAATPLHDPLARGVIFGLNLTHTRGHLYRAAMEGIGYSIAHCLETMTDAGAVATDMVAVGGGVKSPAWLQSVSDITQLPQRIPAVAFGASFGDACLAGIAIGLFTSRQEINKWVNVVKTVEPQSNSVVIYHRNYRIFKDLYIQTKNLMHA